MAIRAAIFSGPVIIENRHVLLNKEKKHGPEALWFFPGGGVETTDAKLEDAARREVLEEMGLNIRIIRPLQPVLIKKGEKIQVLVHWLAERIGNISPGDDIAKWAWHDIRTLPPDCAPNVYEVIAEYLKNNV